MLSIKGREVFEELGRRMDELADLHVRVFLNVSRKPEDTASTAEIVSGFVQASIPFRRRPDWMLHHRSHAREVHRGFDERETFICSVNSNRLRKKLSCLRKWRLVSLVSY